MDKKKELNSIAKSYHLNEAVADKFIEDACQEYCCDWLETLIDKNDKVLELGYGEGHTVRRLSKKTNSYSIIEGSSDLAAVAKSKYPNVEIIEKFFEEYKTNNTYDLVLALHVFEHVDNSIELAKLMRPWLKKNGKMVVIVPNKESLHRRLAKEMGLIDDLGELSARDKIVGHKKVYSLNELKKEFVKAGYEILETKGFFIKLLPNSMMLDYSSKLIRALNRCSSVMPIELLANIAIVVKLK